MDSKRQYSTPTVIRKPVHEGIDAMRKVYEHLATLAGPIQEKIDQCLSEIRACRDAGDDQSVRDLRKQLRRLRIERSWYTYVPAKTDSARPDEG